MSTLKPAHTSPFDLQPFTMHTAHWASQGESCDSRETVLERDGTDVTRDDEFRAVSGRWVSVYDGKTFTDASDLDIDHVVPLANGWRSGANTWTQEERKAFANDLTHPQLLAVSAASNRSKGDQDRMSGSRRPRRTGALMPGPGCR